MRPYLPLILWVILGCFAVFAGSYVFEEQGYFLFSYGKYYFEATMMAVVLMLIGLWFVKRLLFWLVKRILGVRGATSAFFFSKSKGKAELALHQGLTAFLLKDWERAEKLISSSGKHSGLSDAKPLFGAIAADAMGDEDKVLMHLSDLQATDNDTALLRVQLLLKHDELEQALDVIKPLHDKNGKDEMILSLYVRVLRERRDWQTLLDLLPKIEKKAVFTQSKQQELAAIVVENALLDTAKTQSIEAAEQQFKKMPGKLKKSHFAISAYINILAANGKAQDAETLLLKTLKKGEMGDYLPLFRQLRLAQPIALNQYLQAQLKADENNPELLCALGHVAANSGDYLLAGKALGKAAEHQLETADLTVLADAYCHTGQHENAVAIYQKLLN